MNPYYRLFAIGSCLVLTFIAIHQGHIPAPRLLYDPPVDTLRTGLYDFSKYVNPFMGCEGAIEGLSYGGGNIFVGAAVPFGVAKVGIDTYETNRTFAAINGGYTSNGMVTGISMMHESGTGGPAKYGIISSMPLTTLNRVNLLDNTTYWQKRIGHDIAKVGYFSTKLRNGVGVQLSAARHSGILQYDFGAGDKHVLVDISHYLPSERSSKGTGQYYSGGEIQLSRTGKHYTGWGSYGGGFSNSAPMKTYFCGEFEIAPDTGKTFSGPNTDPVPGQHVWANGGTPQAVLGTSFAESGPRTDRVGAIFTWTHARSFPIRSRIGISMISIEKACHFKESEIPTWKLQDTVDAAKAEWNQDVFSKIIVPEEPTYRTNMFLLYTSMYFSHLMPSDRSYENPLWPATDYWDDFYALWDIFRCTVSLWHLIQPDYYASMLRSLIDIWRWEGFMPDGRSGDYNGVVQGGTNADNVLADAFVKDLPGVNWTDAYQAMLKNAEVPPYNQYNAMDLSGDIQQGRGALGDWKNLGYIAADHHTRSVSRTMEYAQNDYALTVLSRGLITGDYAKYLRRAAQWQNIWNIDAEYNSFTGFIAPRMRDGTWRDNPYYYSPAVCDDLCGWTDIAYEATPFEYSFNVPHDMETLIEFMGGPQEFERRLDYMFTPQTAEQTSLMTGVEYINTIMNIGDAPDFIIPYQYHYVNKQYKSVFQSRELTRKYFHNANFGLPGNSDAGALNSWLIWQMIGLYPVATQSIYLLGAPWFSEITMSVGKNKTLSIYANDLDNSHNSFFVQAVRVNGEDWNQNWLNHSDVMVDGGTIEFDLGKRAIKWDTGPVPPSPGHFYLW